MDADEIVPEGIQRDHVRTRGFAAWLAESADSDVNQLTAAR